MNNQKKPVPDGKAIPLIILGIVVLAVALIYVLTTIKGG